MMPNKIVLKSAAALMYQQYIDTPLRNNSMPAGHYYFRDFFPQNIAASPLLAIKLRKDVLNHKFNNVKMVSAQSKDGYIIT